LEKLKLCSQGNIAALEDADAAVLQMHSTWMFPNLQELRLGRIAGLRVRETVLDVIEFVVRCLPNLETFVCRLVVFFCDL